MARSPPAGRRGFNEKTLQFDACAGSIRFRVGRVMRSVLNHRGAIGTRIVRVCNAANGEGQ